MDPIAIQIKEDNGNRKVIGHIRGDTFYTTRKKSKHLLRKLNAWGIDAEVLNDILQGQVKYIEVRDLEEDKTYLAKVETFIEKGKYLHFKPHRAQCFLPLRYWNGDREKKTLEPQLELVQQKMVQQSLFG